MEALETSPLIITIVTWYHLKLKAKDMYFFLCRVFSLLISMCQFFYRRILSFCPQWELIHIDFPYPGQEYYPVNLSFSTPDISIFHCCALRVTLLNLNTDGSFGDINPKGIAFYNRLINGLLLKGESHYLYSCIHSYRLASWRYKS